MFHKKKQEDEFEMVNLRTVYGVYEREALTGLLLFMKQDRKSTRLNSSHR